MSTPIHLISLGAGVQSSCMALMAAAGEITPTPAAAIFADTQAEPKSVYEWLSWLEKQLPFPVVRVTGGDLTAKSLAVKTRKDSGGKWTKTMIPFYTRNPDGSRGIMPRRCTWDGKVVPLVRAALKLKKQHAASSAVQWIGISLDEVHRMKPSRDNRITHRFPLIDMEMTRADCLRWMEKSGFPKPPRSACVYCPYHSDHEWRRLRKEEPLEFDRAVKFERDLQAVKLQTDNMLGVPFLHNSLLPLDQVDFSTDTERGQGLLDGFGNECEGMCGV